MEKMKAPVISIGNQDFQSIREHRFFYIDKTDFIREWWENGDSVTLITRPRRFGKTLTLSMTEQFFSNQCRESAGLFEGLAVWSDALMRELQGTYPVIFLSFANVKEPDFCRTRKKICQLITNLYMKYLFLVEEGFLKDKERAFFESVSADMDDTAATMAIHQLTDYLYRYYHRKVLILLDECDTPLQEAYIDGYWDEMISFIRSLFNATFKTNPGMERGLLTGITRISKESIFSDFNNLEVITTSSEKYRTAFGFTQKEVEKALSTYGLSEKMEQVKVWYDGFCFGSQTDIYNPWSITKYLDSGKFGNYWANTSSNSMVSKLIQEGSAGLKTAMEDLLEGKSIDTQLDEELVFSELGEKDTAVWSLLLASGYLKLTKVPEDDPDGLYGLSLTNLEVKNLFRRMVHGWFDRSSVRYGDFVKALLANDVGYMNEYMNQIALQTFSSFDAGRQASGCPEPERFYHGFVLGLLVDLRERYQIRSNRESGFGRYDVMMIPEHKSDPAYILEFKVRKPDKEAGLEQTVQNALKQIRQKRYDTELTALGIRPEQIFCYGFAFEGKQVRIGMDQQK